MFLTGHFYLIKIKEWSESRLWIKIVENLNSNLNKNIVFVFVLIGWRSLMIWNKIVCIDAKNVLANIVPEQKWSNSHQGPMLSNFLRPQFTNVCNKLECLLLASLHNLVLCLWVKPGIYTARLQHFNALPLSVIMLSVTFY